MKKIILVIVFIVAVLGIWSNLLITDVRNINQQISEMNVDPNRAIICAIVTALVGIEIFIFRQREHHRK